MVQMSGTAFIVLKSPEEQDPSHHIKRLSEPGSASAILLEDGVYHAILKGSADKLRSVAKDVLVSLEDVEARGFSPADIKVGRPVEYPDIVECIMERTDRSVTI